MPQSAFIVAVPEAEARVHALRQRFDPTARQGVPAHVTVLYPFMSPELIDALAVSEIRLALADSRPFQFSLSRVGRFPDAAYLRPDPASPFVRLTESLVRVFPNFRPYGGRFDSIVPHLSVAQGASSDIAVAERELSEVMVSGGPIHSVCSSVLLIENSSGAWRPMHAFSLANESMRPTCEDAHG